MTLFKSLIHEQCFSMMTWKRKSQKELNVVHLHTMTNILKVLLKTINLIDARYDGNALKDDIVYRVLPRKI